MELNSKGKPFLHAIRIDKGKCLGCTHCLRVCPTEAIRVRSKNAEIYDLRCIDCGECIRVCPYGANYLYSDDLSIISDFNYKILVIPETLLVLQCIGLSFEDIVNSLFMYGFNEIWEKGIGNEIYLIKLKEILKNEDDIVINTSCPSVVRFIQTSFPSLLKNLSKLNSPLDILAFYLREKNKNAGIFYLSTSAADITAIKNPEGIEKSPYDGVFTVNQILNKINIQKNKKGRFNNKFFRSGKIGAKASIIGGESSFLKEFNVLSVDGIWNVKNIFEKLEEGNIPYLDYIEAKSCPKGCIGGVNLLTIDSYIGAYVLEREIEKKERELSEIVEKELTSFLKEEILFLSKDIIPRPKYVLSGSIEESAKIINRINEIYKILPKLDCGSCGAPSCKSLAEDVALGKAKLTDCKFLNK